MGMVETNGVQIGAAAVAFGFVVKLGIRALLTHSGL